MKDPATEPPAARSALREVPTPLYHQVQLVLRERIEQGYYGRDGGLPSELELGREFEVSRITVARAINELAAEGLVQRRRGAGTRVVPRDLPGSIFGDIDNLIENIAEIGKNTQVKVLEFGFVLPGPDVRQALGVDPQERVQRAVRVRSYKGEPFSHLTSFVPDDIGKSFDEADLASTSLMSLLERSGVRIGSARQRLFAVLADPRVGAALEVAVGSPLLALTRTVYDRKDRPVEHLKSLYRPDRYQYRMKMEREKEGAERWSTQDRGLRVVPERREGG